MTNKHKGRQQYINQPQNRNETVVVDDNIDPENIIDLYIMQNELTITAKRLWTVVLFIQFRSQILDRIRSFLSEMLENSVRLIAHPLQNRSIQRDNYISPLTNRDDKSQKRSAVSFQTVSSLIRNPNVDRRTEKIIS